MNINFDDNCKLRIPPSPTGNLHLGTARTALYNYILAKKHNGKFVFRLEDTDKERSKAEYTDDIINGLQWLNLNWDEGPLRQSEHIARHVHVLDELLKQGKVYKCFMTTEELDAIRQRQRTAGKQEKYENNHRDLTEEQIQQYITEGREAVIRLRLPDNTDLQWNDMVRGSMSINTDDLGGDFVIAKANGNILYNFAVVVDDHDSSITHIIRGEDHLHNTAKQIAIYNALDWNLPVFGHVPLIFTPEREKLSKRKHGEIANISNYIEQGYLPEAINNYLMNMSWTHPDTLEIYTVADIIQKFDMSNVSKSPAIYDIDKLNWVAQEHFKAMPVQDILNLELTQTILKDYKHNRIADILELVKDGMYKLTQLPDLIQIFFEYTMPSKDLLESFDGHTEIYNSLKALIQELPSDFDPDMAKSLLKELSKNTGIKKGKNLFMPVRLFLTGQKHGPDLISIMHILGKDELLKRLTV